MREISAIIEKLKNLNGEKAVLATVVDVRGSSYRLPGAKMLICESGATVGMVSGGCLEADVLERAKRVLKKGEAQVFKYDTTQNEDSVFSLNMGCRGVIRILLEPVEDENSLLETLENSFENRNKQTIQTLISAESGKDFQIGGKIIYDETKHFRFENIPDFLKLDEQLIKDCKDFYESEDFSNIKEYETERGKFEFFFEKIKSPNNLLIFGAGADAVPLAELARNLGWKIFTADHRSAFLTAERFPEAERILLKNIKDLPTEILQKEQTAIVIMTHNYERDLEILPAVLKSDAFYVGILGPRRRTETLLEELAESGREFSEKLLEKLYAPVGLDIGADTPETIALSILSEIQSVSAGREGGFLRKRETSIYGRNDFEI